ncbi:MAG: cysteine--tRNA ligase [Fusobacterium mortiferum]|jgi:cysteinyl-tRNA synthetase|uniref:Cysteine--tRNA ligase n=2 Tax=Fusobacterium mortiferum TaxID=850 RepID=A0A414PPW1_FUSMR|nr:MULTISPECIES: cysteine--tRNA ligase [Fusobacterium]AVQ18009.1 cysteine--tRNA ligase [Fusobacterium mortiferum ATCC 9817]EEO36750.1 cysteine--tRNA ligase [Fusobacterium mortiferum ATCC 9817]MCF2628480.1 cysteine--tRNA ligase [Fusobacterium mortiferum]MCF2700183.1 cysteine--tRNA ligase [Fusobacterium mortiferum]MCI7186774.1 cysteine--tRNA ligase [Fusobacterium mortiferum]
MIKIYNTLTRKLEEFKPVKEGEVSMYVCGPTVYNYIHIGNARPAIFFDTVRRYFEFRGYKVTYVSNFTDVDDKIIKRANEEGISCEEVAAKYIKAYFEDTAKVNLKEEGMIRPKATEHIGGMIKLIKSLIEKGHAYESQGDVYFDVESYKDEYLGLSHQNLEDLRSGARIEISEIKKSPLDFALWKKAKEGEPSWNSPWGQGRPGWHIECSAMSHKYLGDTFDIHGGGQDLIFPHHENEIAQSKCGCGGDYARYWMHNGYINVNGEKMSKSLGNFFLLRDVLEHYDGRVVRLFVLSSHYRKPIDFSDAELTQAKTSLERIENALMRGKEAVIDVKADGSSCMELKEQLAVAKEKFIAAMDEDFNTSMGLGAIFELVKELNKAVDTPINAEGAEVVKETVEYIINVMEEALGVKLKLETVVGNMTSELIEFILELRREARNEKNWAMSDKIRDRLAEMGIKIKDGKDKTTWTM